MDKGTQTEITFIERCNKEIVSKDPKAAFRGRLAKAVIPAWNREIGDCREAGIEGVIEISAEVAAYILATTSAIAVKPDDNSIRQFKRLFLKSFVQMYLRLFDNILKDHLKNLRKESNK